MEYERYRNRSIPSLPGTSRDVTNGVTKTDSYALPSSLSEQTYDFVVPHFKTRQAAGEIFNNSYLNVKTTFETNDVLHATHSDRDASGNLLISTDVVYDRSFLLTQVGFGSYTVPSIDVDELARKAQIQALGSVNKTDFDVSAFAGEWHQTKNLHRDVLNAIWKLLTGGVTAKTKKASFQKLPVFDARGNPVLNRKGSPVYRYLHTPGSARLKGENPAQRLANAYLVGRYGIAPLLGDLENAVKFLQRKYVPRETARGSASDQKLSEFVTNVPNFHGYWPVKVQVLRTYTARYGILYEPDIISSQLAHLGLTRPLSSAWELLPWSFVADWLLGVGNYLDAIQPAGFTKTLCAWGSTSDVVVTTWAPQGYVYTSTWPSHEQWSGNWSGGAIRVSTTKSRDPWNPVIPSHPAFGTGFSALRSGDFAALVLQRIKAKF